MKIVLGNIPEEGLQHTFSVDGESFEKMLSEKPRGFLLQKAEVGCSVSRIKERVYLKGNVSAVFTMECSRCLMPTDVLANDGFAYVFVPMPKYVEGDTELSAAELDEIFYDGDIIDLTEVVVEQISLLVPFRMLCRDGCKGLCPTCGKNRNEGDCPCGTLANGGKFATLQSLKIKQ